ncbi:PPE family protein [Mycobacterium kansasii 732]|nr:PPE family protein [Mycobacterium kansasii 732]
MVVHPWSAFGPEANYTALVSGSGPASTPAYAETLSAQAAQVQAVVAASAATGAATYGTNWRGVGAAASAVSQSALDTQHELLAAALLEKASHVAAAAGAHQSAVASMVTAQEAVANRCDEATARQLNPLVWGALTPQIVALDLQYYGQMRPRGRPRARPTGRRCAQPRPRSWCRFRRRCPAGRRLPRWWGWPTPGRSARPKQPCRPASKAPTRSSPGNRRCRDGGLGRRRRWPARSQRRRPQVVPRRRPRRRGFDASPGAAASDGDVRPSRTRRRNRRPSHRGAGFSAA